MSGRCSEGPDEGSALRWIGGPFCDRRSRRKMTMARSRQIVSWALVPWLAAGIPACGGGRAPSPGTSAPDGGEPPLHPFESSKRPAEPSSPAKALPPEARAAVPEGGAVALPAPSDAAAGEQTD